MRGALLSLAAVLAGCDAVYWVCEPTGGDHTAGLAATLSATGLDAADVLPFRPRFELWSDGAEKRRWVWLPPGARIDSRDMDSWSFPVGTRFWKEFRRDGVRVETRLIERVGPGDGDWVGVAYLWTADQRDAIAAPFGAVDALGTPHDVPAAGECVACHGGRRSFVLGFSAIQLDGRDLEALVAAGRLSHPPPRLEVPGDATQRAALGYLHANCGHCHNPARPPSRGARCFDPDNEVDLQLVVDRLAAPEDTPAHATARSRGARILDLVAHRGFARQMPPLATERVDDGAVATLRAWIASLEGER